MSVSTRLATPTDIPDIIRVCSEGWRDTYASIHSREYVEKVISEYYVPERIATEIGARDGWDGWLVAELDGKVVGAAGGGKTDTDSWEIFVLYLDPTQRRQGAGRALLSAMTAQALAHGTHEQRVSVTQDNEKGLPFYRAMGFSIQGEYEVFDELTQEKIKTFHMSRPLSGKEIQ